MEGKAALWTMVGIFVVFKLATTALIIYHAPDAAALAIWALALAGIGPMLTRVEIWADPTITRNTHTIRVEAEAARFTMTIENVPSPENPRTGQITALSMLACLRGLVATLKVGT